MSCCFVLFILNSVNERDRSDTEPLTSTTLINLLVYFKLYSPCATSFLFTWSRFTEILTAYCEMVWDGRMKYTLYIQFHTFATNKNVLWCRTWGCVRICVSFAWTNRCKMNWPMVVLCNVPIHGGKRLFSIKCFRKWFIAYPRRSKWFSRNQSG